MKQATLVNAVTAATDITGGAFDLGEGQGCSIHADFSGSTLAGTLKLQSSNDNTDWVDVASSSQAVTSAASHMWNVTSAQYRYIRPVWTASSGTGTLTCALICKENVVKGA